jgi:hypothetical protein
MVRAPDSVAVRVSMAVSKEFLGGEPVLQFDPFQAASIDPEVIRFVLDFRFGRFVLLGG